MDVNIQLLNTNSKAPTQATAGSAGYDLYVSTVKRLRNGVIEYGTGVAFQIPSGYVGLLFARSSIRNTGQSFANAVGVIDSDYRGQVSVTTYELVASDDQNESYYAVGDRCGQIIIIPYPEVSLVSVQKLEETKRGNGGFGSSGK